MPGRDKVVNTITELVNLSASNNDTVYCKELKTRYRFHSSGTGYTVTGKSVVSSSVGSSARWVGISGVYKFNPVVDQGTVRPGDLVQQDTAVNTKSELSSLKGYDGLIVRCKELKTSYRYFVSLPNVEVNDFSSLSTSDGGDTRWIGVEGEQIFVNLENYLIGNNLVGSDLAGQFGGGGGVSGINVYDEGVLVKSGAKDINIVGTDFVAQETVPGSGIIDIIFSSSPPSPTFSFTSFSVSPALIEVGQDLVDPTFNYETSPSPADSISIDNGVGSAPVPSGPFNPTITIPGLSSAGSIDFEITGVLSGFPNATRNDSVAVQHKVYWGAISDGTLVNQSTLDYTDLVGVTWNFSASNQEFSTTRQITKNFNATGGKYIYFIFPTSFGLASPHVQVGPFPVTLPPGNINTSVDFTNESGATNTYTIIRTDLQNGSSITVEVL